MKHEFERALALWKADEPFYGLIMAAMLRADTENMEKLRAAFPDVHEELDKRYWAPGGIIEGDPDYDPDLHGSER